MTKLSKGLWLDGLPKNQPEATWRYCNNGVIISHETDFGLTNERGTELFLSIPEGYYPIGHHYLGKGEGVLFLVWGDAMIAPLGSRSMIIRYNRFGDYTTPIGNDTLHDAFNFNIQHQIECIHSYNSRGEIQLYWVDGYNPARVLNIDSIPNPFRIEDTSVFALNRIPSINLRRVNDTGGDLETGVYRFYIQLLDADFNETNYLNSTPFINVNNDPKTETNEEYDGAEAGIVTTKSITLDISELHGSIRYYRIGVIKRINGVDSYYRTSILPLSPDLSAFTYTLSSVELLEDESSDNLLKSYVSYSNPKTITQLDEHLLLGNLGQFELDYQEKANQIEFYYYIEEFDLNSKDYNYKDEWNAAYERSFARDEVYAPAIVWLRTDGTTSWAFPCPGRAKIEGREISGGVDITLGYDDPVYGDAAIWKATNTADPDSVPTGDINPVTAYYKLAYWESGELYPEGFGDLTGTPVRHIRMPSIEKSPHYRVYRYVSSGSTRTKRIGRRLRVAAKNVQLPDDTNGIAGFKIVFVPRTQENKSVIGQGALFNFTHSNFLNDDGQLGVINSFPFSGRAEAGNTELGFDEDGTTPTHIKNEHSLYMPEHLFNTGEEIVPEYFEVQAIVHNIKSVEYDDGLNIHSSDPLITTGQANEIYIMTDTSSESQRRRNVSDVVNVTNNSTYYDIGGVRLNNTNAPKFLGIAHDGDTLEYATEVLEDRTGTIYGDGSIYFDNGNLVLGNDAAYGFAYYIVNLKRKWFNQYAGITSLSYADCGHTFYFADDDAIDAYDPDQFHTGISGDVFLNNMWFRRTVGGIRSYFSADSGSDISESDPNATNVVAMNWCPIESTVNVDMRNEGADEEPESTDWSTKYYPKTLPIYDSGSTDTVLQQPAYVDNYWQYNYDYSNAPSAVYFAKPVNIAEVNSYANRIIYSQKKTSEDTFDAYRKFLANDYKDIPRHKGEIVKLFIKDNRLYAHCEDALFMIPSDEQRFEVTEGVVNVGTGSFLQQNVLEILSSELGYAGLNSKWASVLTPYGYFFVDAFRKQAFIYGGFDTKGISMKDITNDGLRTFFNQNAKLKLADQIEQQGGTIAIDNPANPDGIGYSVGYDPELRRIIVHKKDYEFVNNTYRGDLDFSVTDYYSGQYVTYNGKIYILSVTEPVFESEVSDIIINGYTEITVGVPEATLLYLYHCSLTSGHFTDKSFTLSYSLDTQSWVSFHDYKPHFIHTGERFHYVNSANPENDYTLTGDYGNIEGTNVYFDVEVSLTYDGHALLSTIILDTKAYSDVLEIDTFDNMIIYNSYQCSGNVPIIHRSSASYVRGIWQINRFRDLVSDYTQPFINNGSLISANIDSAKHWTLKKHFIDDHAIIRLRYNNTNNNKLSLYAVDAVVNKVIR